MTESWIELNDGPARIEVVGEGTPVMVIGAAVPIAWARPFCEALAVLGYRVINFDYGAPSGWEEDPLPKTCLDQVDDVVAVLKDRVAGPAAAVGLSRGAITAYGLAASHPSLVSRLVLAFPVAGFADTIGIEGDEPEERDDPLEALDAAIDTAFSAEFLTTQRQTARDLFLSPPGTVVRVNRDEEATVDDLPTVAVPTLIVSGGEDRVVTIEHPERLKRAIPHATTHEFPTASHGFIMEHPLQFADVVDGFLRP